jgi:hypothetical protein
MGRASCGGDVELRPEREEEVGVTGVEGDAAA